MALTLDALAPSLGRASSLGVSLVDQMDLVHAMLALEDGGLHLRLELVSQLRAVRLQQLHRRFVPTHGRKLNGRATMLILWLGVCPPAEQQLAQQVVAVLGGKVQRAQADRGFSAGARALPQRMLRRRQVAPPRRVSQLLIMFHLARSLTMREQL